MSTVPASLPLTPKKRLPDSAYRSAAIALIIAYVVLSYGLDLVHSTPLRFALTIIDGVIFVGFVIAVSLLVLRCVDEFQRVLLNRAFILATFITMGIVAIWGHLESFGNQVAALPNLYIPAILICITAAAKLLIFRKYKSPAE